MKEEGDGTHGEAIERWGKDVFHSHIPVVHWLDGLLRNGLLVNIVNADSVET